MIDLALKDIRSHKLRSFLTALGIIIAITTIVSLGSISSGINSLVQGQLNIVSGKIIITSSGAQPAAGPPTGEVSLDIVEEIGQISGVESVAGMRIEQVGNFFLDGAEIEKREFIGLGSVELEEGDWPEVGAYEVTMGYHAKEQYGLNIGDSIKIEDEDLKVVGHLEEVGGFVDFGLITSWTTLNDILGEEDYFTMVFVKPQDISNLQEISEKIKEDYPELSVQTAESSAESAKQTISQFRLLTLGIGFIAAIVAMFGIINTMVMSVSEKKKQIGIMKATGATRGQIMARFFEESLLMGIFGSAVGLFLGYLGTAALNNVLGMKMARVTPGLAFFSVLFAMSITIIATIYPALKAAKIDPISAIRGH
ncbi:MAG: FtsX-like permease family protein [archaeon]